MSGLFLHGLSTDAYTNLTLLRLFFKVHLLHLLVCLWWNTALPATLTWSQSYLDANLSNKSSLDTKSISRWVINLVCAALMCVTGEFLCMRTELRTIPVNMAGGNTAHQQPKTDHL